MTRASTVLVLLCAATSLFAGCGTNDGDYGECNVVSCGGDVVGDWTVVDHCGEIDFRIPDWCPTATGSAHSTGRGTLLLTADGVFDLDYSLGIEVNINYPSSCFSTYDGTCEEYGEYLATLSTSASCSGDIAEGCQCIRLSERDNNRQGPYEINDRFLKLSSDPLVDGDPYCVDGDTMTLVKINIDGNRSALNFER